MKKNYFLFMLVIFITMFSCKPTPKNTVLETSKPEIVTKTDDEIFDKIVSNAHLDQWEKHDIAGSTNYIYIFNNTSGEECEMNLYCNIRNYRFQYYYVLKPRNLSSSISYVCSINNKVKNTEIELKPTNGRIQKMYKSIIAYEEKSLRESL